MGVTIEGAMPLPEPEAFEVMRANANALSAWIASETQWRVVAAPSALIWLGLDYQGVDVVLRRMRLADPDDVFADLQVMEGAALDVFGEERT